MAEQGLEGSQRVDLSKHPSGIVPINTAARFKWTMPSDLTGTQSIAFPFPPAEDDGFLGQQMDFDPRILGHILIRCVPS